jgi:hypothetical protein
VGGWTGFLNSLWLCLTQMLCFAPISTPGVVGGVVVLPTLLRLERHHHGHSKQITIKMAERIAGIQPSDTKACPRLGMLKHLPIHV